jgi:Na+/H+ antiporter NhaC
LDTTLITASIPLVLFNEEKIELQGHTIQNDTSTGVVPLWMSILPPLFAIFLALVFKEVIFSLVTGIFVGAAVMGFYAEGFIGIFTGLFRVIDTYVMYALNDFSHLSVIVFSILIGGVVALISKNGSALIASNGFIA